MKKQLLNFVSSVFALCFVSSAFGATHLCTFKDFSVLNTEGCVLKSGGYTVTLGTGNTIGTGTGEGGNGIPVGAVQIGSSAPLLLSRDDVWAGSEGITVILKYSKMPDSSSDATKALISTYLSDVSDENSGLGLVTKNNTVYGLWQGKYWDSNNNTAGKSLTANSDTAEYLVLSYSYNSGTKVYDGSGTSAYDVNVLRASNKNVGKYVNIGALNAPVDNTSLIAEGMIVEGVTVYKGALAQNEIATAITDHDNFKVCVIEDEDVTTAKINELLDEGVTGVVRVPDGATVTLDDTELLCKFVRIASTGSVTIVISDEGPSDATFSKLDFSQVEGSVVRTWESPASLGVNFNSAYAQDVSSAIEPDGIWTHTTGATGSARATGDGILMVTWSASVTYVETSSHNSYSSGSHSFIQGYLDDGSGVNITVANIPYKKYDLYIYCETDGPQGSSISFSAKTVNGTSYTCGQDGIATAGSANWGTSGDRDTTQAALGTNTMVVQNLTGSTVTLSSTKGADNRGCVAAIQIVDKAPVQRVKASTIGVNFCENIESDLMSSTGTDNYGFVNGDKGGLLVESAWQNVTESSDSTDKTVTLTDSANNCSYTMVYRGGNANANGIWGPGTVAGNKLLYSYIDNNATIEINGLPTSGYDVALIFSGDSGSFSRVTVNTVNKTYTGSGTTASPYVLSNGNGKWGTRAAPTANTTLTEGVNVMYLADLNTQTLTLQTYKEGTEGGRGTIAAIQIFIKEGATANPSVENTRTIEGAVDWVAADAWARGDDFVNMPFTGDAATITVSGEDAATLTMNADAMLETVTFNGTQGIVLTAGAAGESLRAKTLVVNTDADLTNGFCANEFAPISSLTVGATGSVTLPEDARVSSASNAGTIVLKDGGFVTRAEGQLTVNERYVADGGGSKLHLHPGDDGSGTLGTVTDGNEFIRVTKGATLTLAARDLGGWSSYAGDKLRVYVGGGETLSTLNLLSYTSGNPGCYTGNVVLDNQAKVIGDADGGTLVQWATGSQNTPNVIVKDNAIAEWSNTYWRRDNDTQVGTHINVGANAKLTFSALIRGRGVNSDRPNTTTGELNKYGTGELIVTAAQTQYTGETKLHAGQLTVSGEGTLGSGKVTSNSGTTIKVDVAEGEKTLANEIQNGGDFIKTGAGTLVRTGIYTEAGTGSIKVNEGTLRIVHNDEPLKANKSVEVNAITDGGVTTQAILELTGGFLYFGSISGAGKTLVSGTFSLGASDTNAGSITTENLEVTGNLRYKAFVDATVTHNNVHITSTGRVDKNADDGANGSVMMKIATKKALTNEGTISVPVTFAKDAIINNTASKMCAIDAAVTFEADGDSAYGLTILLPVDYVIPTGGETLLAYTSKTGDLTDEDITITFVDAEGNSVEKEVPTSWHLAVTETAITLTTQTFNKTLPADGTTWGDLLLTPSATDDVTLTLTEAATLTIDSESVVSMNNLLISGGTLTINNADKLSIAGEINIAEGATLILNGTTGEDDIPLIFDVSAITGGGNVIIREGKVKFQDVAIGVPVETKAAEGEKAIGTLYLTNTANTTQTIATVITNNGTLVTDGTVALERFSMSNALTVRTGTLTITGESESIYGDITIESPATLKAGANNMCSTSNNNYPRFVVKGTLNMATFLWTIAKDTSFKLYSGASVTATSGTLQFNGGTVSVLQEGTSAEPIDYGAIFKLNGATTIDVASGLTLNITGVVSQEASNSQLKATGAGTVVLSAANTYTGGTDIGGDATVEVTNRSALGSTGAITGSGTLVIATDNTRAIGNNRKPLANTTGLTAKAWSGTVVVKTTGSAVWLQLGLYGHAGSHIQCHGVKGFFNFEDTDGSLNITAPVELLKIADRDGLTIDDGSSSNTATVTFAKLTGEGTLDLNSNNKHYTVTVNDVTDYRGSIIVSANNKNVIIADADATVTPVNGKIVIAKDVTAYSSWKPVEIGEGKTLSVQAEAGSPFTWNGALSGSGTFKKVGTGTVTFSASVADATKTVVSAGTLALGTNAPKAVTVQNGATLDYAGVADKVPGMITLEAGATLANSGTAVGNSTAQMTDITLTGDATVVATSNFGMIKNSYAAVTLNLDGHKLTKEGAGNFWFCRTTIEGGTGESPGEIYVKKGQFTKVQNHATVINGKVKLSADGVNAFDFGGDTVTVNGTLELGANASLGASPIAGHGTLVKSGNDTTTLTGDCSAFTGAVRVDGGILDLTGVKLLLGQPTVAGVAEGATLKLTMLPCQEALESVLLGRAPVLTLPVTGTVEGTLQMINGSETITADTTMTSGQATFTGAIPTQDTQVTGEKWWWDYEFDGVVTGSGRFKPTLSLETGSFTNHYEDKQKPNPETNQALYFHKTPYTEPGDSPVYGTEFTAVMRCKPGNHANVALIGFGSSTTASSNDITPYAITLATGKNPVAGEMQLLLSKNFETGVDLVLGGLKVNSATDAYHLYVFTMSVVKVNVLGDDGEPTGEKKNVTKIEVYADGKLKATHTHDSVIVLGKGFQIGSIHGGVVNAHDSSQKIGVDKYGTTANYDATTDTGLIDFLRVADFALSQEAIQALSADEDYAYHSTKGTASRTVSANGDWVTAEEVDENKPWTQVTVIAAEDGTTTSSSKENSPTAGTNVELTMSADATLTLNTAEADIAYESFYVKGAGTLTIKAGTHAINSSEVTVETSMVVPYDAVSFAGTSVTITGTTERNVTLTIDVSALKGRTWVTTNYPLTGLTNCSNGSLALDTTSISADAFGRTATLVPGDGNTYSVTITVPAMKATVSESTDWDNLTWAADGDAEAGTFTLIGEGTVTFSEDDVLPPTLTFADNAKVTLSGTATIEGMTLGANATVVLSDTTNVSAQPTLGEGATIILGSGGTAPTTLPLTQANFPTSGTVGLNYETITLSEALSGSWNLSIEGGTTTLTQANENYSGTITVKTGATLSGSGTIAAPLTFADNAILSYATAPITASGAVTFGDNLKVRLSNELVVDTVILDANLTDVTLPKVTVFVGDAETASTRYEAKIDENGDLVLEITGVNIAYNDTYYETLAGALAAAQTANDTTPSIQVQGVVDETVTISEGMKVTLTGSGTLTGAITLGENATLTLNGVKRCIDLASAMYFASDLNKQVANDATIGGFRIGASLVITMDEPLNQSLVFVPADDTSAVYLSADMHPTQANLDLYNFADSVIVTHSWSEKTPIAVWDRDFKDGDAKVGAITFNQNGNFVVGGSLVIGNAKGAVFTGANDLLNEATYIIEGKDLIKCGDKYTYLWGAMENDATTVAASNKVCVVMRSDGHAGIFKENGNASMPTDSTLNLKGDSTLIITASTTGGVSLYRILPEAPDKVETVFEDATLTFESAEGFSLGGVGSGSSELAHPEDWTIDRLAVFNRVLTTDEMLTYAFPSQRETVNASTYSSAELNAALATKSELEEIVFAQDVELSIAGGLNADVKFVSGNKVALVLALPDGATLPADGALTSYDFSHTEGDVVLMNGLTPAMFLTEAERNAVVGFNFHATAGGDTSGALETGTWVAGEDTTGRAKLFEGLSTLRWQAEEVVETDLAEGTFQHGALSGTVTVTLTNLPNETYDLILYGTAASYTVNGTDYTAASEQVQTATGALRVKGLTGATLTIACESLAAIQILPAGLYTGLGLTVPANETTVTWETATNWTYGQVSGLEDEGTGVPTTVTVSGDATVTVANDVTTGALTVQGPGNVTLQLADGVTFTAASLKCATSGMLTVTGGTAENRVTLKITEELPWRGVVKIGENVDLVIAETVNPVMRTVFDFEQGAAVKVYLADEGDYKVVQRLPDGESVSPEFSVYINDVRVEDLETLTMPARTNTAGDIASVYRTVAKYPVWLNHDGNGYMCEENYWSTGQLPTGGSIIMDVQSQSYLIGFTSNPPLLDTVYVHGQSGTAITAMGGFIKAKSLVLHTPGISLASLISQSAATVDVDETLKLEYENNEFIYSVYNFNYQNTALISGSGSVRIQAYPEATGLGAVTMTQANTYSGGTVVEEAMSLTTNVAGGYGAQGSTITVASGATVDVANTTTTDAYNYVIAGSGIFYDDYQYYTGALYHIPTAENWTVPYVHNITLAGDALIRVGEGRDWGMTGTLDLKGHSLRKQAPGTWHFNGVTGTYGTCRIMEGALEVSETGATLAEMTLSLEDAATLTLNGNLSGLAACRVKAGNKGITFNGVENYAAANPRLTVDASYMTEGVEIDTTNANATIHKRGEIVLMRTGENETFPDGFIEAFNVGYSRLANGRLSDDNNTVIADVFELYPFLHYDFNGDDGNPTTDSLYQATDIQGRVPHVSSRHGKAGQITGTSNLRWESITYKGRDAEAGSEGDSGTSPFNAGVVTITTLLKPQEVGDRVVWALGDGANATAIVLVAQSANTLSVERVAFKGVAQEIMSVEVTNLTTRYHFVVLEIDPGGGRLRVWNSQTRAWTEATSLVGLYLQVPASGRLGHIHGNWLGGLNAIESEAGCYLDDWQIYDVKLTEKELNDIRLKVAPDRAMIQIR